MRRCQPDASEIRALRLEWDELMKPPPFPESPPAPKTKGVRAKALRTPHGPQIVPADVIDHDEVFRCRRRRSLERAV
jgi:hypothetical protein